MIDETIADADERMQKSIASLDEAFKKIRTGRAHPDILDSVQVSYYGSETPMIGEIEKAIMKSDLGLNPSNNGDTIRVPMPPLTEETRKEYTKQAKAAAENARIAIRNIRRDANSDFKELEKEKEISEDEQHKAEDQVQKITDKHIATIESSFQAKEADLLSF